MILVVGATAVAAYTDIKTRRIPNAVSGALLAGGLVSAALNGWQHAAIAALLFVSVFFFGTLLFSLRLIGGGDVKLSAAAAAALGWPNAASFLLFTILAGGILGLIFAIVRGRLRPMLSNLKSMVFPVFYGGRPVLNASAAGSMPYGLAIFAGAITVAAGDALGLSLRIFQ